MCHPPTLSQGPELCPSIKDQQGAVVQTLFHTEVLPPSCSVVCPGEAIEPWVPQLHTLSALKRVMEVSLVRTLANKYRTTCTKISQQYGATIQTQEGRYKVLRVMVKRQPPKKPLTAYFGGLSLKSNKWVSINDQPTKPIWSGRSEVVERLLAQECELCSSAQQIEVHHVRKLADLHPKDGSELPEWKRRMAARRRKTLVVCHTCHEDIQYGSYDGELLPRKGCWRAT